MDASEFLRAIARGSNISPELRSALDGKRADLGEDDATTLALIENAQWVERK